MQLFLEIVQFYFRDIYEIAHKICPTFYQEQQNQNLNMKTADLVLLSQFIAKCALA